MTPLVQIAEFGPRLLGETSEFLNHLWVLVREIPGLLWVCAEINQP